MVFNVQCLVCFISTILGTKSLNSADMPLSKLLHATHLSATTPDRMLAISEPAM